MGQVIDLAKMPTQSEFGALVGIAQSAVSVLMSEGKLPTGLPLGELLLAYCARLREQAAGRMGDRVGGLDLAQERAALAREMRLGHEIKNAVARGRYAPTEALAAVLASASQAVVERLDQLPASIKTTCPDLPDAVREQLMVAIAASRNEWVRATASIAEAAVEGWLDDELDEPDQAAEVRP